MLIVPAALHAHKAARYVAQTLCKSFHLHMAASLASAAASRDSATPDVSPLNGEEHRSNPEKRVNLRRPGNVCCMISSPPGLRVSRKPFKQSAGQAAGSARRYPCKSKLQPSLKG